MGPAEDAKQKKVMEAMKHVEELIKAVTSGDAEAVRTAAKVQQAKLLTRAKQNACFYPVSTPRTAAIATARPAPAGAAERTAHAHANVSAAHALVCASKLLFLVVASRRAKRRLSQMSPAARGRYATAAGGGPCTSQRSGATQR